MLGPRRSLSTSHPIPMNVFSAKIFLVCMWHVWSTGWKSIVTVQLPVIFPWKHSSLTGQGLEQPPLTNCALIKGLDYITLKGPFQSQLLCNPMKTFKRSALKKKKIHKEREMRLVWRFSSNEDLKSMKKKKKNDLRTSTFNSTGPTETLQNVSSRASLQCWKQRIV